MNETPEQRATREAETRAFGQRLRKQRLTHGSTRNQVAEAIGISYATYQAYELGSRIPRPGRMQKIVAAIGCPLASLFVDEVVLAELRVSDETLERVRREGAPAAAEIAQRMAASLSPLLLAEATRPPVDLRPHARPKKRRDRAAVLAGSARAKERSAARKKRDAESGEIR